MIVLQGMHAGMIGTESHVTLRGRPFAGVQPLCCLHSDRWWQHFECTRRVTSWRCGVYIGRTSTGCGLQSTAVCTGAVTWDTDDYSSAAAAKLKKAAEAGAAAAAGGAAGAAAVAARPNPKQWYDQHHAKYKESAFTTGATARAFTSTVAVATTKSERQLQRVDRNPTKKGGCCVISFERGCVVTQRHPLWGDGWPTTNLQLPSGVLCSFGLCLGIKACGHVSEETHHHH